MSATRRTKASDGEQTVRERLDNYPTPAWVSRVLVGELGKRGVDLRGKRVLECAAGDGAMATVLAEAGAHVDAIEIDPARCETLRGRTIPDPVHGTRPVAKTVTCGDFLAHPLHGMRWDAVITNPPYGELVDILGEDGKPAIGKNGKPRFKYRDLALEFVQRARTLAPLVCFILRLNWAGSKARHDFHRENPADLVVLANRPKFRPKSSGDATEYAWWIWNRGQRVGSWSVHFSNEAPHQGRKKGPAKVEAGAGEAAVAGGA